MSSSRIKVAESTSSEPEFIRALALSALHKLEALPDIQLVEEFAFFIGDRINNEVDVILGVSPSREYVNDGSWSTRANNLYFLLDNLQRYSTGRMWRARARGMPLRILDTQSFEERWSDGSNDPLTVEGARDLIQSFPIISTEVLWNRTRISPYW